MKKILGLIALVVTAITLVACSTSNEFRVDIFIYEYSDTYIGGVRTALEKEIKDVEKMTYRFHDAGSSQETQNTQIDAAITAGSKLLVVNIVETASAQTLITRARNAGIPIVFFNREVTDAAINSYDNAAFVGTDPDEAGYLQGELAADLLLAEGNWDKFDRNKDGNIGYIMLRADLDNPEANGRTRYSIEEANRLITAANKPALQRVGQDLMASWSTARATELFDSVTANTVDFAKVDAVFANNDDMAIGAIQSLNKAGYNLPGGSQDKFIPIFGVDATVVAQGYINGGQMSGSILQDGDAMAKCLAAMIKNTLAGNEFIANTNYKYQTGVKKIRIPYAKFTGNS